VCWGGLVDAAELARRFALGQAARLSDGPVARGRQGLVWRLDTAGGSWAVKVPFHRSGEDEVRLASAFQEAACAAGVPAPLVRRTTEGWVFAAVAGRQVRVYEWVDLHAPDSRLDPARVGAVVAAIHRVSVLTPAHWTRGITNRLAPSAGTIWWSSLLGRERRSHAGWPICAMSWSR
jgi:Ser/Thr protein kinase RdoA (MazF antagonist)